MLIKHVQAVVLVIVWEVERQRVVQLDHWDQAVRAQETGIVLLQVVLPQASVDLRALATAFGH
jgi:hypothetical protein